MTMYLAAALILLQGLDYITTRNNIVGGGRELNGFVAWLMRRFGLSAGLFAAKAVGAAMAVLLWALGQDLILAFLAGLYCAIVWRNWRG